MLSTQEVIQIQTLEMPFSLCGNCKTERIHTAVVVMTCTKLGSYCMQKVVKELWQAGNLATFFNNETQQTSSAWELSLASYKIAMGVGLYKGWAIETRWRLMSYLSPHVNLASRLESATKKYNVPLLMSEAFFGGLSGSIQLTRGRCDQVAFKGSTDPMVIYHHNIERLLSLQFPTQNHSKVLEITM